MPSPGRTPTPTFGPAGTRLYRAVARGWRLDTHHRTILVEAARTADRIEEARAIVDAEGLVTADRWGQRKPHPAALLERDLRGLLARLLRELGLNASEHDTRPPALHNRYLHRD